MIVTDNEYILESTGKVIDSHGALGFVSLIIG
jgi:hypothetical protein